jgi:purine-cytosine permease-like protein
MLLGATVGTFLTTVGTSANAFLPFAHQSFIPAWFVDVFLVFCIFQLFAINSLDLYSSGVTLLAMGVNIRRNQAVVVDCLLAGAVTMIAIFNTSFNGYLKDFVDLVIVWIAPWFGIFIVDWWMRRSRYVPGELQRTDRGGLYYRRGGFFWPAIVAQLVGMFAAIQALSATFHLPRWLNLVTYHTADAHGFGADFSVFFGIGAAALVYLALGWRGVRSQAEAQDRMLAAVGAGE